MKRRQVVALLVLAVMTLALVAHAQSILPITRPGMYPDLAVGPDNSLHVVWLSEPDTDRIRDILYTHGDGTTSSALVPLVTTISLLIGFTLVSLWLWWHFNRGRPKTSS